MEQIDQLRTVGDVVKYWRECLANYGKVPDDEIASWMCAVQVSDHIDEWYQDGATPMPCSSA